MPPAITQGQAVRKAVLDAIASPKFLPPPLPFVNAMSWPDCFVEDRTEDGTSKSAQKRLFYSQTGIAILQQSIFLLVVEELAGKSGAYLLAIRTAVQSRDVMEALVEKIDKKLLANIDTSTLVDAGFYEFIGVLWDAEGRNTEVVATLLRPILEPLLSAAGKEFLTLETAKLATRQTSQPKGKASAKSKGKKTDEQPIPLPADLQFILNVRRAQTTAVPSSALPQTPRHPSQPGNKIYYGPSNFNVGLSPSAFDLNSDAVTRGEVLTEDLHDFQGHERNLDVAGARLDHSPRAQLQATELLKTLLTDSAKAGEASPRSVSLALEDLMRTILARPLTCRRSSARRAQPYAHSDASILPARADTELESSAQSSHAGARGPLGTRVRVRYREGADGNPKELGQWCQRGDFGSISSSSTYSEKRPIHRTGVAR
ncbi:hypothetical protein DFH06DRAFT_1473666 [Mycena polygramma]|nr:hypothetical protein DFH06DRAFT_1473666 [Mycena polygramma]